MKKNYPRVNYGQSVHGNEEIKEVVKVLKSSTQMGNKVRELEEKIAKLFKKKYGVMTNSGSSALFLSIKSLNLKKNSEVITPALTFGTTVASLVQNNLIPVFVDVKLNTFCIDEDLIEKSITKNTVAIAAPDLIGNICEWKKIKKIANKYKLILIQDSADTLGSKLNNDYAGKYSDISITSFYGSHIINGAGNGGMLCTNSLKIYNKTKILRSWGRSSSLFEKSEKIENRFNVKIEGIKYDKKFVFEDLGYQMEPSEISAAFALAQLKNLNKNILLRRKNFTMLLNFFKKYENIFHLPFENTNAYTAWLAFPLIIKPNSKFDRTELQIFFEKYNIQTRVLFTGNILRQPGFRKINYRGNKNKMYNADIVMRGGMLLGCHHGMKKKEIDHIKNTFKEFLNTKNIF